MHPELALCLYASLSLILEDTDFVGGGGEHQRHEG
jgi:hypothetical protein